MLERHVWTICLCVSAGAVASPPTLLEIARERSTVDDRPALLEKEQDSLLGSRLSMDFGVSRIGETSRALKSDGLLGEMTGEGLNAQPIQVEGVDGPVRLYEAAFTWQAAQAGPVRFNVLGGVRAYGLSQRWSGVPGTVVTMGDSASDEIVPIPVFGGEMSVELAEGWSLNGRAHGTGSSYIDLGAESAWSITPQMDVVAGYKFLDASVTGSSSTARLRTDGVYAQVKWRF